jgi:hypothetical protein
LHRELGERAGERVSFRDDFGRRFAAENLDGGLELGREGRFRARGEIVEGLRRHFAADEKVS